MVAPMPQMPQVPQVPSMQPAGDPLSELGLAPMSQGMPEEVLGPQLLGPPQAQGASYGMPSAGPASAGAPVAAGPGAIPAAPQSDWPVAQISAAADASMTQALDLDIRSNFERRHGRAPTTYEVAAVNALPMIEMSLGRKPTRTELLGYLSARDETPADGPAQFEPDPTAEV